MLSKTVQHFGVKSGCNTLINKCLLVGAQTHMRCGKLPELSEMALPNLATQKLIHQPQLHFTGAEYPVRKYAVIILNGAKH